MKTLNVEYRKVDSLIPYARNPRTHSQAQVAQIAASIVEFGYADVRFCVENDCYVVGTVHRVLGKIYATAAA